VERLQLEAEGIRLVAEVYLPEGQGPHPALCICHGVPAKRVPDATDRGYPVLATSKSWAGRATWEQL